MNTWMRGLVCWFAFFGVAALPCLAQESERLPNGIQLPAVWPPVRSLTQEPEIPPYLTNPPQVIPIDLGRQLFVDDFLIEQTNLVRTQHRPAMYEGNPVVKPGELFDISTFAAPFSDGAWFDSTDGLFKMWYFGGLGNFPPPYVSYAYSNDGKNWVKPQLPEAVIPDTNMVIQSSRDSSTVWMDPDDADPARRFKAFIYGGGRKLKVYFSANGIEWQLQPFTITTISDRTTVFWNPFRRVWVNSLRASMTLPDAPGRPGYGSRLRFYAESKDLINWNPADVDSNFWVGPDTDDPPYEGPAGVPPQLYNLDGVAYESLIVGLFSWFYQTPGPDLVEIGVGFSRDGFHWFRPTRGGADKAFVPASNTPNTWNGYNSQSVGGGFLVVGDQLYFYFSGRDTPHSVPANAMSAGLATLRRDGFYSMRSGATAGSLTTRPVLFSGNRLFVNVDNPLGELRVEILDSDNNVIAPFTQQNCIPIADDTTLREVKWTGVNSLQGLAGTPVKFRFHLVNGDLYSFWVSPAISGASNGYLAAGGPGYSGLVDVVGSGYDTTPPQGSLVRPLPESVLSEVVELEAEAVDNIRVKGVRFLIDGAPVGLEVKSPPYKLSFDTRNLPDGLHRIKAVVRDGADNSFTTPAVDVIAANDGEPDTTPPSTSVISPGAGDEVSGTVLLVASATDETGVAGVQFRVDGVNVGAELSGAPFTLSLDTNVLPDGPHSVSVVARDVVGNTATTAGVEFSVNNAPPPPPDDDPPLPGPDTILPTVSLTAPVNWPQVSGSVMLSADATDNAAVAGVQFQINGVNVGAEDNQAPFEFLLDTTLLANAVHFAGAVARDYAGNVSLSKLEPLNVTNKTVTAQTSEKTGLYTESELGSKRKFTVAQHSLALGRRYVYSYATEGASVIFRVRLTQLDSYVIWARVESPDVNRDSYKVSINGGQQYSYDSAQGRWSSGWRWTRVNGGTPGGLNPMITQLGNSYHNIIFTTGELNVRFDGFLITNDLYFVPTDEQFLPGATPPTDVTPPSRLNGSPSGALPAGTAQATLSLATDEPATCRYAQNPGTGYSGMPNNFGVTGGTAHTSLASGLQNGSVNSYYVRCIDAAGNANADDFLIQFSVSNPAPIDSAPPLRTSASPLGSLAAGTTQATLMLATDEAATCKYATIPNAAYSVMPNVFSVTGGVAHSSVVSGLQNGLTYSYYARCLDSNGNVNTTDFPIQFSIASSEPPASAPGFAKYIEAELGFRRKVQVSHDVLASRDKYVYTPDFAANGIGSVEYPVTLPKLDLYVIWARVRTPSANSGKFDVRVDGGSSMLYDTAVTGPIGAWKWVPVYSDPITLQPRTYALTGGPHVIRFGAIDEGAAIDGFVITNDPTHVPSDALYVVLP